MQTIGHNEQPALQFIAIAASHVFKLSIPSSKLWAQNGIFKVYTQTFDSSSDQTGFSDHDTTQSNSKHCCAFINSGKWKPLHVAPENIYYFR